MRRKIYIISRSVIYLGLKTFQKLWEEQIVRSSNYCYFLLKITPSRQKFQIPLANWKEKLKYLIISANLISVKRFKKCSPELGLRRLKGKVN